MEIIFLNFFRKIFFSSFGILNRWMFFFLSLSKLEIANCQKHINVFSDLWAKIYIFKIQKALSITTLGNSGSKMWQVWNKFTNSHIKPNKQNLPHFFTNISAFCVFHGIAAGCDQKPIYHLKYVIEVKIEKGKNK